MKKLFIFLLASSLFVTEGHSQVLKKLGDKVKNKTGERADQKVDNTIDKALDKTEESAKNATRENSKTKTTVSEDSLTPEKTTPTASLKVYQNYDFVPGDKILFEDNFTGDQDGEFASHWELEKGQAVLNKLNGELAMYLTEGNYAKVFPRMKTEKYLSEPFTVEYDYYHVPDAFGVIIMLKAYDKQAGSDRESPLFIGSAEANFNATMSGVSLSKYYPDEVSNNFENRWHHIAVAVKNHQLKVYVDQNRVLVVPDTKEDYDAIVFAGLGDEKSPIIFKNVRIATGGDMNMIGKKFTETKIVTHGINFEVNKATIKPESMGTLNMVVQVMKDNPDLKFEVGGHTDSDGSDNYNLTLSQQRADAVKDQLIKMGIAASRLTAKGYGESKPISDNNSLDGKANNRRVEFVKN